MNKFLCVVSLALSAFAAGAVEWTNLDELHHLGGRKATEGYLQGKVVLVNRWGPKFEKCKALLPRMEEIWQSFKSKPFVVLGGSCPSAGDAESVKKVVEELGLTYPMYEGAGLTVGEPSFEKVPVLYVVDETGKVVYCGHDDRTATQAVVSALTDMESPRNIDQWRRFLCFELDKLPGRAYLRMKEFKKKFPKEAKEFEQEFKQLQAVPDVKRLAELVEFAKKAKDMREFTGKQKMQKQKFAALVSAALTKYASLKDAKDPRVVQEAKNSLADLKWTKAAL